MGGLTDPDARADQAEALDPAFGSQPELVESAQCPTVIAPYGTCPLFRRSLVWLFQPSGPTEVKQKIRIGEVKNLSLLIPIDYPFIGEFVFGQPRHMDARPSYARSNWLFANADRLSSCQQSLIGEG